MMGRAIVLVLAVLAVACSGELVIENAERQASAGQPPLCLAALHR